MIIFFPPYSSRSSASWTKCAAVVQEQQAINVPTRGVLRLLLRVHQWRGYRADLPQRTRLRRSAEGSRIKLRLPAPNWLP